MSASAPVPPAPTELETALVRAGQRPRFMAGDTSMDPHRLVANRIAVEVELDASRPTRLARLLARVGVAEGTIPLITATPALRRSWLAAIVVALLFAVSAASNSTAEGAERIVTFLTIAPLVPLLGVALAFGRGVDPTHELVLAAPMDAFRVFLVRAATVMSTSTVILLIVSLLVPDGGAARVAWLLPALAATAVTTALATRFEPRLAAGVVAAAWVSIVVVVSQATDPAAMFGPATQLVCLALAVAGGVVFHRRRLRIDTIAVEGNP